MKNIMKNWKTKYQEILKETDKEKLLSDYIHLMSYIIDLDIFETDAMKNDFNVGLNYKL